MLKPGLIGLSVSRTDQESPPAVTDPRIPPPAPRTSGMEP